VLYIGGLILGKKLGFDRGGAMDGAGASGSPGSLPRGRRGHRQVGPGRQRLRGGEDTLSGFVPRWPEADFEAGPNRSPRPFSISLYSFAFLF
jgi:hypothetical protein